jgi:plasmid stabilization system protein ParE
MQVIFRPEAQAELLAAQAWYEDRSPGLGFEFARAADAAIARAQRTPLSFPSIEAEFRHVMARKFPYSIIYRATDTQIVVVSCFHHRRKPGSWLRSVVS